MQKAAARLVKTAGIGMAMILFTAGVCAAERAIGTIVTPANISTSDESAGLGNSAIPESIPDVSFDYLVGQGDVLQIKVWRHPDLDLDVLVRPDCQISVPIANEIPVCNETIPRVREKITRGLSHILRDPQVTVNVVRFKSQKVFVLGEVIRPGLYSIVGSSTLIDALAMAQGHNTETAQLSSVLLIRGGRGVNASGIKVDVNKILQGRMDLNPTLQSGDIVFVPKTFIAEINKFVRLFVTGTNPMLKYYLDLIDIDQRTPQGRNR